MPTSPSSADPATDAPIADVTDLNALDTPCLLLDEERMQRNVARLTARLASLGVGFRPHLKTAKSIDVARAMMTAPDGPATVSTLKEAEYFAAHGVRDLLYAVAIAPHRLARVAALRARGADVTVIVDSVEAARAVAEASRASAFTAAAPAAAAAATAGGAAIPALIEIDSDGHRSGVAPDDAERLLAIAGALADGAALRGVMTHAGESYNCRTPEALEAMAEQERAAAVRAAGVLRAAGRPCPIVSVGSTPTAHAARRLDGVTEVRAGVFVFFDLVMAGLGVCTPDDVALSVLATVIGHQRARGWTILDAGWMALSRDRGTSRQPLDQGYGLVCDLSGRPYPDFLVLDVNQEHGIAAARRSSSGAGAAAPPDLPIGARVRILPNHACATGAQHDRYHVVTGRGTVRAVWPRLNGW